METERPQTVVNVTSLQQFFYCQTNIFRYRVILGTREKGVGVSWDRIVQGDLVGPSHMATLTPGPHRLVPKQISGTRSSGCSNHDLAGREWLPPAARFRGHTRAPRPRPLWPSLHPAPGAHSLSLRGISACSPEVRDSPGAFGLELGCFPACRRTGVLAKNLDVQVLLLDISPRNSWWKEGAHTL